jgi:thermitase
MKSYAFLALLCAAASVAQERAGDFVKDTLLVQRREASSPSDSRKAFAAHGAAEASEIPQLRVHVLRVPEQAIEKVRAALLRSGQFEFVEREGVAAANAIPLDPMLPSQWHHYTIDMPGAWLNTMGSVNVPIAILDGGVDGTHPDLSSKMIPGYNFVALNTDTADLTGHGTKVAGSAAAATDNGLGVAGVAAKNPIMPIVVMNASSVAYYSSIAKGITYAADRGVRIINISITGTTSSSTLQSAVNYAWSKNAVVFAAAGNASTTAPGYPAACDKVIAVGATDSADLRASYSNYGSWIDIVAPGSNILTTLRGGGYGTTSGTSFASPITAGVGALMLSVRPDLTATQLTELIKSSAKDLGAAGFDIQFGSGRLDANRAVVAALQAADTIPSTTTAPAPTNGKGKK